MSVSEVYKSLNEEQRRLLADKHAKLSQPVDDLIAFLKPIAACDKLGDKTRSKFGCGSAVAFLLVIPFAIMWGNGAFPSWLGMILVAAAVITGIMLVRRWSWLNKIDVSNNLRGLVLPVLQLFREDFDRTQPVQLDLDLRPPTDPAKQKSKTDAYASGAYYKIIDTFYVDPWMTGEAMLTDGTRLRWSISDSIRERAKTKKNARGKHKTKTRYAKKTSIDVEVALKAKQYELGEVADAEVIPGEKKNVVRVTRRLKSDTLDPVHPAAFIDLVAGVYRGARPVK
ncbi:MAG TPA: hypothetical protein VF618_01025 [Thermoanaerobaculia bacterium]